MNILLFVGLFLVLEGGAFAIGSRFPQKVDCTCPEHMPDCCPKLHYGRKAALAASVPNLLCAAIIVFRTEILNLF